jgi:hypothetical protein
LDRYRGKTGFKSQQTPQRHDPDATVDLWEPADSRAGHDFGAHGIFDNKSHQHDPQLWASHHHRLLGVSLAAAAAALLARLIGRRR